METLSTPSRSLAPLADLAESLRLEVSGVLARETRSDNGQFLTPPGIARIMAGMFTEIGKHVCLLDPGAGVGSLTAAFVERALAAENKPETLHLVCYEIEDTFIPPLRSVLNACVKACTNAGIQATYDIHHEDFLGVAHEVAPATTLFTPHEPPRFTHAILNPPYKKITQGSDVHALLLQAGLDSPNLYSSFMLISSLLLVPGGELVAISPRSYCNGPYFLPFRRSLLGLLALQKLHAFHRRDIAFSDDDVLQETIILHGARGSHSKSVLLLESDGSENADTTSHTVPYSEIVHQRDPESVIHVTTDQSANEIQRTLNRLVSNLSDVGITISTGRVVDFRARAHIHAADGVDRAPLLYPSNLRDGRTYWPSGQSRKPQYIDVSDATSPLLVPDGVYVLVKRFTAKEERRRVVAAVHDPHDLPNHHAVLGLENHLNYFHENGRPLDLNLARGLSLYLNSSLVDAYFRLFSGHTQVNASDLRRLKYPSRAELIALGRKAPGVFPPQEEIDRLVEQQLKLMPTQDPLAGKRMIDEALGLLRALAVPREQQNERSALTLLALLGLKPGDSWTSASNPLLGITEMMDYFREHFGKDYAPNTRETVRRFTVHQFVQLGLVQANPDMPRAVNSPQTVYQVESGALNLIRGYLTSAWESDLAAYLDTALALRLLRASEREMAMLPVTLPSGKRIRLSAGGQNALIKTLLEEFCPRFTPGGRVLYIGDAGKKFIVNERAALGRLGVKIDAHGKMPDVVIHLSDRKWLVLVEAVTSHGPVNIKRHNELKALFVGSTAGLVFVTAFPSRKEMNRYLSEIAWETEVWVADAPTHLIHFNGDRFLGPHDKGRDVV